MLRLSIGSRKNARSIMQARSSSLTTLPPAVPCSAQCGGKKVPPQIQRIQADDLLASVFPQVAACQENVEGDIEIPDHPLVREVMKDVLSEAMDLDGLKHVLRAISSGAIRTVAVDTPVP